MKVECNVGNETAEVVKALVERRNESIAKRNETAEEKLPKATFASMCEELITTGANRRAVANKWADEHPKAKKPRAAKKAAAPKPAKKSAAPKKAKAPTVRKAAKKSEPAPAAAAAPEAPAAAASPLD